MWVAFRHCWYWAIPIGTVLACVATFFVMQMVSLRRMAGKLQGEVAERSVDDQVIAEVLRVEWPFFEFEEKADPAPVSEEQFFAVLNTMVRAVTEIVGTDLVKHKLKATADLYRERTGASADEFMRRIRLA